MKDIKDYTLSEILYEYKDIIIKDRDKLIRIFNIFFRELDVKNEIQSVMESAIIKGNKNQIKINLDIFEKLFLKVLIDPKTNNDDYFKKKVLAALYVEYPNELNYSHRKDLQKLMFTDKEYYIVDSTMFGELDDYVIVTKTPQEKLSDIKNRSLRDLFGISLQIAGTDDLKSIIRSRFEDETVADYIEELAIVSFLHKRNISDEGIEKLLENSEDLKMLKQGYSLEIAEVLRGYLKNNLQLLDKTMLLYNAAARLIEGIKLYNGEKIEGAELGRLNIDSKMEDEEVQKESIEVLRKISKEIEKYEDSEWAIMHNNVISTVINKQSIKDFLARCTQKEYITDKRIEEIHSKLQEGIILDDLEVMRISGINVKDLVSLNFSYIFEEDEELRSKKEKSIFKLINYLKSERLIDYPGLLDLYLNGDLYLDIMKELPIDKECIDNKFLSLYQEFNDPQMQYKQKDTEGIRSRFSRLYRAMEEKGEVSITDLIKRLEKDSQTDKKDIIYNLYKFGFVLPEKILEMFKAKFIDECDIAEIIIKMANNTEKFIAIAEIFPENTAEHEQIRNFLVSICLELTKEESDSDGITIKTGNSNNLPPDKKEYITDPFARKEFFKTLDKDILLKMTSTGYLIGICENSKKVIIERMYDEDGKPYYGAATYILDMDYFNKHKGKILVDGEIRRKELTGNRKEKGIEPIQHTDTWVDKIKEEFGYNIPGRYTAAEQTAIDGAADRVNKSKKLRE